MEDNNQIFSIQDIMGDRFGKYSKYIIQDRALPDVRDGLKPVQRRILFAMHAEGNTYNKPHRKSAKTVGNVIGNYHPHGDSSVYEAMVRMSQWWKLREPLIDMHGNNGSIDNDPAAAMRYTEARLSAISSELLKDIEKDTVKMSPNFDDTLMEPTVLPARFPALLVNGAKGIAAGYATEIPPHNLNEVIDAVIYRLKNPNCQLEELMQFIKGPDFPTGGIVQGKEGIIEAFNTGRGRCVIKSKTQIQENKNENQIIITEIPYEVVKSDLVRSIDQIRYEKKIDGIIEVRDESDKEGLRIVVDIKKDIAPNLILNYLMKQTSLQVYYNYNVIVINNKTPMQLGLVPLIDAYIAHQIDVDTARCQFDLNKAQARLHIIEGLVIAINNIDEVITLIRSSSDKSECKTKLIERFSLSEKQAEAIVSLQLYRLSSTDINLLLKEKDELIKLCEELVSLLSDEKKMKKLIMSELSEVSKKYQSPRKSAIEDSIEEIVIDKMAMVSKEEVMIAISRKGYCKRSSLKSYNASESPLPGCKQGDLIVGITKALTTDILLVFTSHGNFLYIPVYELGETKWKDEGIHINNLITLSSEEYFVSGLIVKDFNPKLSIVLLSKNGIIKKTSLGEFVLTRYNKPVKCMKIMEDDEVVSASYSDGDSQIVVLSELGNALRYHEDNIPLIGLRASGVKAISDVKKVGSLVGMIILHANETKNAYLVTNNAGVKVINPKAINLTNRTNKVTQLFRCFKSDPHQAISFNFVNEEKTIILLGSDTSFYSFSFEDKAQPFEKNMKNDFEIKEKTSLIYSSNYKIDEINDKTPFFEVKNEEVSFKKNLEEETKIKNVQSEEQYEKISILDLLDVDF